MKRLFFAAATMLLAVAGMNAQTVLFDFSDPSKLGQFGFAPMSLTELQTAKYYNASLKADKDRCYKSSNNHVLILEGEDVSKDGVKIHLSNPDAYKDYPRFFFGLIKTPYPETPSAADFYCDMRWYQKEVIEFTAPEGKKITKIEMNATSGTYPTRANGNTIVQTEGGTQTFNENKTVNTWVANADANLTSVKYVASSDSPTQMAYSIEVTLADYDGSGVAEIAAQNQNVVDEYYDLNGVKVAKEPTSKGIYVKRSGEKVSKVIVK